MCFSATASFGAGAALSIIGIASLKKTTTKQQVPFACIPLLFALQQFIEGFLWLTLPNVELIVWQQILTHVFLFFAQVIWPIWIPFAIILLQERDQRTLPSKIVLSMGICVAIYQLFCLISFDVSSNISGHHVDYDQDYPESIRWISSIFYIASTIAPHFLSRQKGLWILGTATLISCIITVFVYKEYLVSVWCFFASIMSMIIYAILRNENRAKLIVA